MTAILLTFCFVTLSYYSGSVSFAADADEALLSWTRCQVRHRDRTILDLRSPGAIHRGHLLGILGPSGSGKTTFLNAISGGLQETPTLRYTHDISPPILKTDTAFIYQEDAFFSQLTVQETLLLAGALRLYNETDSGAATDVLQFLGLDHVTHAPVGDPVSTRGRGLSGGERKRLAVACEMLGTAPKVSDSVPPTLTFPLFAAAPGLLSSKSVSDVAS